MSTLPDRQPTATAAGQAHPDAAIRHQADQLMAALDEIANQKPTRYRDTTPVPAIGTSPPVPQPGVPPMSQRTTETVRAVMFCSLATVPPGLLAIGVMLASEHADPTVIGMICAAPAAIAVPIFAFARLLRSAKDAAPTEIHQHYTGTVIQDQRTTHTSTRGVWARTNNRMGE